MSLAVRTPTNPISQSAGAGRPGVARRPTPARCLWCGRSVDSGATIGRPRMYCGQSCRQRAYENRRALQRGELPADVVVLTADEHADLADRLYQMRCAAEDVATAVAEKAPYEELVGLMDALGCAARDAERIR